MTRDRGDLETEALLQGLSDDLPEALRERFGRLRSEIQRLRAVAYNEPTGLPSHVTILPQLREHLDARPSMAVFLLSLENLADIEKALGWQAADDLLGHFSKCLRELIDAEMGEEVLLAQDGVVGEQLLAFQPRRSDAAPEDLGELERLATVLRDGVAERLPAEAETCGLLPRVGAGYSVFFGHPFLRLERLVGRAIAEARSMLEHEEEKARLRRKMELRQLIADRHLRVAYQPIVELENFSVMGHEALCRGPEGTHFANADVLFSSSQEHDLAFELDEICREKVLVEHPHVEAGRTLFLNVLPESIMDGRMDQGRLVELVVGAGLAPSDVVLEIAERGRIASYDDFRRRLDPLREHGFRLAVDDIGRGYSSLRVLPEVEPDYLKVDASLIQGIDAHPAKQGVLSTIVDMGARLDAEVIAEGIERPEELELVVDQGVHHGQGYYLMTPGPRMTENFRPPPGFPRRPPA
ncbi:MAG: EAL domain-containing protein [Acidobacteriota bacterium]